MEELERSCIVLQTVCYSIQTLLGPNKSLKCYISTTDADSAIFGDTMQVLDALMASHLSTPTTPLPHPHTHHHPPPTALHLLQEYCQQHQMRFGCGVTTMVCLSGYWATEILSLIHQGIPLPVVFAIFREALDSCKILQTTSLLPLANNRLRNTSGGEQRVIGDARNTLGGEQRVISDARLLKTSGGEQRVIDHATRRSKKQTKILSFSRHFRHSNYSTPEEGNVGVAPKEIPKLCQLDQLVSMKLVRGRSLAMKLAFEARRQQCSKDGSTCRYAKTPSTPPKSVPLHYFLVGKPESSSRIVRGVVMDLHHDMLSLSQSIASGSLRLLMLDGDCTPGFKHLGFQRKTGHVISHDTSHLHQESRTSRWLSTSIESIKKFEINVLIVGGTVCPSLWQHCIGANILVLKEVSPNQRKVIAATFGAFQLNYLIQTNELAVGKNGCVEVLESGWEVPRLVVHHHHSSTTSTSRSSTSTSTTTGAHARRTPVKTYCCRLFKDSSDPVPPPYVVTALLCGLTESIVDHLRHTFINCHHRLRLVINTPPTPHSTPHSTPQDPPHHHVLPGGGETEATCIRALERISLANNKGGGRQTSDSKLPLYFIHSWMNKPSLLQESRWRSNIYQAFANGLRRYLVRVILNSRSSSDWFGAMSVVESMIEGGGGDGSSCREDEVLDVAVSKWEAWRTAVELLETIFFSKRIDLNSQKRNS